MERQVFDRNGSESTLIQSANGRTRLISEEILYRAGLIDPEDPDWVIEWLIQGDTTVNAHERCNYADRVTIEAGQYIRAHKKITVAVAATALLATGGLWVRRRR